MVCSIWLASTTTGSFSKNEPASCMRCCSAAVSWAASWLCSTTRTAYSVALLKSSASWSFRLEEDSLTCLFANKKLQIGRVAPFLFLLCPGVDRKSTRRTPVTNAHLVCRLLLEKKKHKN